MRCTSCLRTSRPRANLYTHVAVVEGPGGAISTTSELYVEYLCTWCGERVVAGSPVRVEDVDPL